MGDQRCLLEVGRRGARFELVEAPPFCGLKGRTRLAVLDGVAGAAEIDFLVASLGDRELLMVVGQAFTEDAEP